MEGELPWCPLIRAPDRRLFKVKMKFSEITKILETLDFDDLQRVITWGQDRLIKLEDPARLGYYFDRLRDGLVKRFPTTQVDMIKPWRLQTQQNKQIFKAAFIKANQVMQQKGFEASLPTQIFLTDMLVNSEVITKPDLSQLITALSKVEIIFEQTFPSYSPEAVKLMSNAIQRKFNR